MGCAGVRGNSPADIKSREIDKQLLTLKYNRHNDVKILLLGPGESGKSTVFKQMKILSSADRSLSEEERMTYKQIIFGNCISQMRILAQNAAKLKIPISNQSNFEFASTLITQNQHSIMWTKEVAENIMKLWSDAGIQQVYTRRDIEFQLNDSAAYFFENIPRFIEPDYIPTNNDVLRVRVRSTGIEETSFNFDDMAFRITDVGGQRSERRKWIHCFSGVTTILFCASLIGYCQTLREQEKVSRMQEAIDLFSEVTNSPYFTKAPIILFLNKADLFTEKIKEHPLVNFFPQFEGGDDEELAKGFLKNRFMEVAPEMQIFTHHTIAVDTKNIELVINSVRANVLNKILEFND